MLFRFSSSDISPLTYRFATIPRPTALSCYAARTFEPPVYEIGDDFWQIVLELPIWKMRTDLAQIRDVANVVAYPIRGIVLVTERVAHLRQHIYGFQNGQTVLPTAPYVVNLASLRTLVKFQKESRYIAAMDLVSHLLSLVARDTTFGLSP